MSDIELLDPEPATLTVEARAAVALKTSETEQHLRVLATKNAGIVAILDKAGREQAHGAAMELKRTRTAIEATSKAARDDATKFSKAIIAEEKRLIAIIEPEETRLLTLRDDWDEAMAEIKAQAERAERARVMAINERIAELRGYVNLAMQCRTAERIGALVDKLTAAPITAELYQEFESEAVTVKEAALTRLAEIFADKKAEEDERARIKAEQEAAAEALRIEREALAKAQAEAQRIADDAAAEMAAQRAAFEAEQEFARQALAAQALQIQQERAALEISKAPDPEAKAIAEYAAAISAEIPTPALSSIAQSATETIATDQTTEVLVLTGEMLSMPMEPAAPPVDKLIQAVADTFNVPMFVAAEWLASAADEIAEFE